MISKYERMRGDQSLQITETSSKKNLQSLRLVKDQYDVLVYTHVDLHSHTNIIHIMASCIWTSASRGGVMVTNWASGYPCPTHVEARAELIRWYVGKCACGSRSCRTQTVWLFGWILKNTRISIYYINIDLFLSMASAISPRGYKWSVRECVSSAHIVQLVWRTVLNVI